MARRYYSSTAARTTLASGVDDTTTTFNVTAVSGWPASYPYTLVIDQDTVNEELVEVSARSGTTLTVTRGVDGTSAVAHDAGAAVNHGVSARDFDEPNAFINGTGTVTETLLASDSVTSAKIVDGTIVNADINASAAIAQSKIDSLTSDLASKGDVAGETWTGTHDFTGATVTGTFPANDGAEVLTGEATTSTSFTDLTTAGPAVTLTTGTKAFVIISCWLRNNNSGQLAAASFAVSGATTRAASSDEALRITATANSQPALKMSVGFIVEGLTAGSNTFTMKYRVSGGSGDFEDRQISVIDMGS